jgi:hypothetical protein
VTLNLSAYLTTSAAASTYYLQTNPTGYITSAALSPYLLSSTAATTYAPIAAGLPTGGTVGQVLTKNSGSNFDASFATLIPGDRYLTTSTTSLTINNDNKTLTVGTGLSYTPQQDVVIAYDASNHMHAQVLTYNSGTGVMTVDVQTHTGSGTFSLWTVNVGGTVPQASVTWGSITGTLGNQTDLATALNAKLEVATAASTYFTIASAAGKANLSGATFTGKVVTTATATTAPLNIAISTTAPTTTIAGDIWVGTNNLFFKDSVGIQRALLNSNTSNSIITTSVAPALQITQNGTGDAFRVNDETPDTTPFVISNSGRVGIGVAPDGTAALKVDTNGIMFGDGSVQNTAATGGNYINRLWLSQNFWGQVSSGSYDSMMNRFTFYHSSPVIDAIIGDSGAVFSFNGNDYSITYSAAGEVGISGDATGYNVYITTPPNLYLPGYFKYFP